MKSTRIIRTLLVVLVAIGLLAPISTSTRSASAAGNRPTIFTEPIIFDPVDTTTCNFPLAVEGSGKAVIHYTYNPGLDVQPDLNQIQFSGTFTNPETGKVARFHAARGDRRVFELANGTYTGKATYYIASNYTVTVAGEGRVLAQTGRIVLDVTYDPATFMWTSAEVVFEAGKTVGSTAELCNALA